MNEWMNERYKECWIEQWKRKYVKLIEGKEVTTDGWREKKHGGQERDGENKKEWSHRVSIFRRL